MHYSTHLRAEIEAHQHRIDRDALYGWIGIIAAAVVVCALVWGLT